jgi:hypothetical protein
MNCVSAGIIICDVLRLAASFPISVENGLTSESESCDRCGARRAGRLNEANMVMASLPVKRA